MAARTKSKGQTPAPSTDGREMEQHSTTFSKQHGELVVRDQRIFRRGREAFCRRLASAAARQGDVRSVQIRLDLGTCRMEFATKQITELQMAEKFARAVKEATSDSSAEVQPDHHGLEWGTLAAFPARETVSLWEIVREAPDRLKIHNVLLRYDSSLARKVGKALRGQPGVLACRVSPWRHDLTITYDPAQSSDLALVSLVEAILQRIVCPDPELSAAENGTTPTLATGLRRLYYLTMAGGSFVLTLIGLAIPGIPTAPFLLATSYYLVRSSPRLNRVLSRSWFLGPILTDLSKRGGLRPINKIKLIGLTLVLGTVTLVLIGPPLVLVLLMIGATTVSIYTISRLPGIPSRSKKSSSRGLAPASA
jgi:uncharacterized membrane protein YbaN (DUF454 family)